MTEEENVLSTILTTRNDDFHSESLKEYINTIKNNLSFEFTAPTSHIYDIYCDRLLISKNITHEYYAGLEDVVCNLNTFKLPNVNVLEIRFPSEEFLLFTDEYHNYLIGYIVFKK